MDMLTVLAGVMPDLPTVAVEARTDGPYGPVYGAPVDEVAYVAQVRRTVYDSRGAEVLSESTVYLRLAAVVADGSRITLPDGQTTTVIAVKRHDGFGAGVPEHLEVMCR